MSINVLFVMLFVSTIGLLLSYLASIFELYKVAWIILGASAMLTIFSFVNVINKLIEVL